MSRQGFLDSLVAPQWKSKFLFGSVPRNPLEFRLQIHLVTAGTDDVQLEMTPSRVLRHILHEIAGRKGLCCVPSRVQLRNKSAKKKIWKVSLYRKC